MVVGAGQAGLACARLLQAAGVDVVVLEQTTVAASWRGHYDRLTLNTDRRLSALPGRPIPAEAGQWVSRDAFVSYLQEYAEDLPVRTGTRVCRLERDGSGWLLRTDRREVLRARHVVLATGLNRVPHLPPWPGSSTIPLLHSGAYRSPAPFAGLTVLVIGAGTSGSEIAADLAGTSRVLLSARTPPALFPRALGPVPTQLGAFSLPLVPSRVGDLALAATRQVWRRRDAALGLHGPAGPVSAARRGQLPVLDAGLRAAVHAGRVQILAAVDRLDGDCVLLADGSRVRADVLLAATGWRPGLEPLVGHLGILDGRGLPRDLPAGLHAVGFATPLTGSIHAAGFEAAAVVTSITGGSLLRSAVTGIRRRLPLPA